MVSRQMPILYSNVFQIAKKKGTSYTKLITNHRNSLKIMIWSTGALQRESHIPDQACAYYKNKGKL